MSDLTVPINSPTCYLLSSIKGSTVTFSVTDTTGFAASGTLALSAPELFEIVSYAGLTADSFTGVTRALNGTFALPFPFSSTIQQVVTLSTSGGVSDGDKGDITVSGSGTVWSIDNGAVTLAKQANMTSQRLIGRISALSGAPEELHFSGGIESDGASGIQTSAFTGDVTKAAGGTITAIAPSVTLTTPNLGTPASGTLTNCSGLPNAGVVGLGTLATQSGTFSGTSSGTNTGDQTSVSGNAGTATALQTARTINGVSFNGSANIIAALYGRVTGSNVTQTAQTLADITGLSVALLANSVYDFQACLSVASSSTAGNGYGIQFSTAGATVEAQISGTSTATASITKRINALNTSAQVFNAVAAGGGIWIEGIIVTGVNAGNLTIQHLKVTSGTATVYVNSYLRAIKIG